MIFTTAQNKVIRYGQRKTKPSEMPDSKADPAASDSSDLEDRENCKIIIINPVRTEYLPLPTGFLS